MLSFPTSFLSFHRQDSTSLLVLYFQAVQYIKLPVFGTFNIPAAVSASASAKIIPSHPFAAMISIVTGRYSSFNVMVELYAA
jgi:hypothetical protein